MKRKFDLGSFGIYTLGELIAYVFMALGFVGWLWAMLVVTIAVGGN